MLSYLINKEKFYFKNFLKLDFNVSSLDSTSDIKKDGEGGSGMFLFCPVVSIYVQRNIENISKTLTQP